MAKNKTTENNNSVKEYLNAIIDENRQKDCSEIIKLVSKQTGFEAKMWGTGIVGFGSYHYKYESGHEGDAPLAAFASRSNGIALYMSCDPGYKEELLEKFGKYKKGKGCIYIKKLEDIDKEVLGKMFMNSITHTQQKYPLQ